MPDNLLPSWRPGPARDRIVQFLDEVNSIPVRDRVAYFDNDGTLWAERPSYVQLDFFLEVLRERAVDDPSLARQPEFAAVLDPDPDAIADLGLARIATALASLFDGQTPEAFGSAVDRFVERYRHPTLGLPLRSTVYQPMLELIAELRKAEFTIGIVTGGGTEFVRRISHDLYGVAPELVVGTLVGYTFSKPRGVPELRRDISLMGRANEGSAKVVNIQTQLGRPPVLAAGNSGGDREMLEWAATHPGPGLALLIDHDDAAREFSYTSTAQTFAEEEPITDVASRLGWTTVSMAADWHRVFSDQDHP